MKTNFKLSTLIGVFSILAFSSITIGGNAFADTTYTSTEFPDADFFTCVKANGSIDTSATSITQAQAESITSLSCSTGYNIQSTEGVQYLSNITNLTIMSQPNLTSIDLTHNNKLQQIVVSDNATLSSLVIGQQPTLNSLRAQNNAIQQLDISNAPAIIDINLYNNKLSSINLTKNTALTNLVLSKNQLSSVDLSANTNLILAYLYDNNIEYIDVSKINDNLLGLYLDDNVLVRTNFVAVQLLNGGNYYADSDTSGSMFIPMLVATGLGEQTKITTPGATFYHDTTDEHCNPGNPFCIIFDADILNYQNYVQLAYIGEASSQTYIDDGRDGTKLNYRLEINLEAYREDSDIVIPNTGVGTPDTGIFSGENGNAISIITSVSIIMFILGTSAIIYGVKHHHDKIKFQHHEF